MTVGPFNRTTIDRTKTMRGREIFLTVAGSGSAPLREDAQRAAGVARKMILKPALVVDDEGGLESVRSAHRPHVRHCLVTLGTGHLLSALDPERNTAHHSAQVQIERIPGDSDWRKARIATLERRGRTPSSPVLFEGQRHVAEGDPAFISMDQVVVPPHPDHAVGATEERAAWPGGKLARKVRDVAQVEPKPLPNGVTTAGARRHHVVVSAIPVRRRSVARLERHARVLMESFKLLIGVSVHHGARADDLVPRFAAEASAQRGNQLLVVQPALGG